MPESSKRPVTPECGFYQDCTRLDYIDRTIAEAGRGLEEWKTHGAFGGLHVNENLQVMGKKSPIANLYASGDITSDNTFHLGGKRGGGIEAEGGWASTSGYMVGETVGKLLKV
jgi:hypothetical protein